VPLPRLILTGASGFVGRHLLEALSDDYEIIGIARETQARVGALEHPNVTWHLVDIGHRLPLSEVFRWVKETGGAETVIHLAAHYDFTGDADPEYYRTNVDGLRNVLSECRALGTVKRFVFSSSVAACAFPKPGKALTEESPPDGDHIYAETKRLGEAMLSQFADAFPSVIVRFAAMFSDWCEYPPLFMFLSTWLSKAWNRNILGGRGVSAIPYLHVRDAVDFLRRVLDRQASLAPGAVLIASPDGAVTHRELYEVATLNQFGARHRPVLMPKILCGPGMQARDLLGLLTGERPFERPWMARYIDQALTIDASRTRALLDWAPRPRLEILRRMPFLIENLKTDPLEWNLKNRAAMKKVRIPSHLRLYRLLEAHEEEIVERYHADLVGPRGPVRFATYQKVSPEDHAWNHRVVLRHLMNAVRTRDKGVLVAYCRDLAERRQGQGFHSDELCAALDLLSTVCFRVLRKDRETDGMRQEMLDLIAMPLRFGCDQVQEVFEQRAAEAARPPSPGPPASAYL